MTRKQKILEVSIVTFYRQLPALKNAFLPAKVTLHQGSSTEKLTHENSKSKSPEI